MPEKIVLIGGGGHCKVVLECILKQKQYKITGILDVKARVGEKILDIPIIGTDDELEKYFSNGIKYCFITVGSVGVPDARIKLYEKAKKVGFKFPNLINLKTTVSDFSSMGEGNFIAPGVIINAGVVIGNNCIINTGAIIDHDCKIGDFVHIAPGVTISGGVKVGKYSHIGTGSSIIQYITIGERTIIGIGSVVTKNIGNSVVAYGNSCKEIKENG